MKTTLLVMTLNEIDGMRIIMPQVDRSWCDQIIVVDGGSTDGTVEWAEEQGYEVHRQVKKGIRQGYLEVFPQITGDVVITFSPDGNSLPEAIPQLISEMQQGYDLVVAARYKDDASSEDDDIVTGFGNWFFTRTVNLLFRGSYNDVMVIYRAYKKRLINDLGLDQDDSFTLVEKIFFLPSRQLSWEPMLSVLALKYGYKVAEIPSSEPKRIGGERKLKVLKWGGAIYLQFLLEFLKPIKTERLRANRMADAEADQAP